MCTAVGGYRMDSIVKEWVYSPHYDFFIDWARRSEGYEMRTFHVHKKYELYYQVDGARRYYIDDGAYLVNAGNLVLIGPDGVHKTGSVDNSAHTRYVMNFSREYLDPLAATMPDVDLFSCFETGVHVLNILPRNQPMVEGVLSRIYERRTDKSGIAQALRRVQLAELLLYLGEYAASAAAQSEPRIVNKTVDEIQSYISTHYREDLSLNSIAAQFYMSPYYISRLFKRTTNLSLVEYTNSVRVMAAKNLLERTQLRIPFVAEQAGFSTTAHFNRVFKESTGLSPQQYRKYYQNVHAAE